MVFCRVKGWKEDEDAVEARDGVCSMVGIICWQMLLEGVVRPSLGSSGGSRADGAARSVDQASVRRGEERRVEPALLPRRLKEVVTAMRLRV
jgi:hypothetical protein